MLILTIFLGSLIACMFLPSVGISSAIEDLAKAALYGISNLKLVQLQSDYFSPSAELNLFTHTWSLGVEEQFYVIFPFLFFLCLQKSYKRIWGFSLFSLLVFGSLFWTLTQPANQNAFYSTAFRLWEIAVGVLAFFISQSAIVKSIKRSFFLDTLTGIILLGTLSPLIWPSVFSVNLSRLIVVFGASVVLVLFENSPSRLFKRFLSYWPMVVLGKISYSLYLIHWVVISTMRWTSGVETFWQKVVALMLSLLIAILTYYYVEIPFRSLTFWKRPQTQLSAAKIITFAVLSVIISVKFLELLYDNKEKISITASWIHKEDWNSKYLEVETSNCKLIEQKFSDAFYWVRDSSCPQLPMRKNLFVIGDSHGGSYNGLLRKVSYQDGVRVHLYSQAGCGLVTLRVPEKT